MIQQCLVVRLSAEEVVVVQPSDEVEQAVQLLPSLCHGPHRRSVRILQPCFSDIGNA